MISGDDDMVVIASRLINPLGTGKGVAELPQIFGETSNHGRALLFIGFHQMQKRKSGCFREIGIKHPGQKAVRLSS